MEMNIEINKELFIEIINSIKEQNQIDYEVGQSIEKISDTYVMINSKNKIYNALYKLLEQIDTDDFIGWWLYEDVEKVIWVKDKKIKVDTPEKLYDFLKEHGKD
jgi:hypothetical protein